MQSSGYGYKIVLESVFLCFSIFIGNTKDTLALEYSKDYNYANIH